MGSNQSPRAGGEIGRWGRGFSAASSGNLGILERMRWDTWGFRSIHTPIAFLRSAGAVSGAIGKGSQPRGWTFAPVPPPAVQ